MYSRQLSAGVALAFTVALHRTAAAQDDNSTRQQILVTARMALPAALAGVEAERVYSEDEVATRGSNSVGDFVDEVTAENGDEEPVFLVNGQEVSGIDDVSDYPAEAISEVQVLPRGSGQKLGRAPGSRVYNVVLKQQVRSATVSAGVLAPTEGGLTQERGEVLLTQIRGPRRINLALRARGNDSLLEADRGLVQPAQSYPYAIAGNVLPFPLGGTEIEPALSALAGRPVAFAGAPEGEASPTLADFAALADRANPLDEGAYRTLRSASHTYEASLSAADRFSAHLTGSAVARVIDTRDHGLLGLPYGLFVLSSYAAVSPFGRDTTVALAGPAAKDNRTHSTNYSADGTLNYVSGPWQGDLQTHFDRFDRTTLIDRQPGVTSAAAPLPAGYDPFGGDNTALFPLTQDRVVSHSANRRVTAQMSGPVAKLPAGFLRVRGRAELQRSTLDGRRSGAFGETRNSFARDAETAQIGVDIPLASRAFDWLPWLGEMSASVDLARSHLSAQGTFGREAFGVAWQPVAQLNLTGSISRMEQPLDVDLLADPVEIYDSVRVFDPLTGDTVEVRQITGGNPSLRTPVVREKLLSASLSPWKTGNLRLDASFRDTDKHNAASYLPPASLALLQAFPERFPRDRAGVLVQVDSRPVSFASERRQELQYGVNLAVPLADKTAPAASGQGGARTAAERATLQFSLTHVIALQDRVTVATGGPTIDLLRGGAIGFGGGTPRHVINATLGIGSRAWGVRLTGQWRSGSELETGTPANPERLRFAPIFQQSLRAFAELGPILPHSALLHDTRLSLVVENLGDRRQRVADESGLTPLRYQPAYRDALGRTVEFELRKVF